MTTSRRVIGALSALAVAATTMVAPPQERRRRARTGCR